MKTLLNRFASRSAATLLVAVTLTACAEAIGPEPGGEVGRLERIGSADLQGTPGFPLPDSVRVRVVGPSGEPLPDMAVRFTAVAGGGSASPATAVSNAEGIAATRWVLGPGEGEHRLEVTLADQPVEPIALTANARYSSAAGIVAISASSSQMPVGCPVAEPLSVRVTDAAGAPVAGAQVLFMVAGGAAAEGELVTTNAEGIASISWRVRSPAEQVVARLAGPAGDEVRFDVSGVPVAPGGYATVGNVIYGPDCAPHRFVGAARPGLQWWPDDARLKDPQLSSQEFQTMKSWGMNVLRLPLYQRYWLRDLISDGVTYDNEAYQALIKGIVERANAAGLAVILDLHTSDRGDPNFPSLVSDIQQMADVAHSIPFWKEVAAAYKGNGSVVFQLYTEPNQIDWELWRNGGIVPGGDTYPPQSSGIEFEAAGMQDLYDAVRSVGADNLVIVNGLHWGYDLSGIPEYALDGYNIVYATHPYDYPDKQPDSWWDSWGFLTETYPVMIAEFGDYTCNENGYYNKILDFADQHQLSWLAWAWWAPPEGREDMICGFPTLITDWAGTPSPTGQVVRARLQQYKK